MRLAVVGCCRPIKLDWWVRRHGQPISLSACERPTRFILNRHQIELTAAEMFWAEVAYGVGRSAFIYRITIRISKGRRHPFDNLLVAGQGPVGSFEERHLKSGFVLRIDVGVHIAHGTGEDRSGLRVGIEGLVFTYEIGLFRGNRSRRESNP